MTFTRRLALVLGMGSLAASALAQPAYPSKPIRIILPYAPGGPADVMIRAIGQKMSEAWGQPVIVDNKPGANEIVAADALAKSAGDGYTFMVASDSAFSLNQHLYPKIPYDPVADFVPVSKLATAHMMLVARPDLPAANVKEFIELVKRSPGKYNYGSTGNGASNHLSMEMLKSAADLNVAHIPYKGGAAAMMDLMAGQVPMMFVNFDSAVPHVKSGKMRAIAVTSLTRREALPDVPTVAESGFPGFEAESWTAISGPPNMPAALVLRINEILIRIAQMPDVREKFAVLGLEASLLKPDAMKQFVKQEVDKWGKAVRASGATVD